jgi:hypothetical protein
MLTEQRIRETSARRTWAVLPTLSCAIGTMFLHFLGAGLLREHLISLAVNRFGDTARDITPFVLILPAFAILLVPSLLAIRYADRFKTVCPSCDEDVSSRVNHVLSTRCCPTCGKRIVDGGRIHSAAVYQRYLALQSHTFLRYWLWAWPAFGLLLIAWQWFDRSAFQRCPQMSWIIPLLGTSTAGWTWLRTFDRRYVPQLLTSAVLLGLGASLFWQTL